MSIRANPYQSPPETESQDSTDHQTGGFGKTCLWAGFAFASIGILSSFLPNLPPLGFVLIAFSFFVVTLIGGRGYRKRAFMGIMLCLVLAGSFLFQRLSMNAKLAVQRARQQAIAAERAARQAVEAMAESGQPNNADFNAAE